MQKFILLTFFLNLSVAFAQQNSVCLSDRHNYLVDEVRFSQKANCLKDILILELSKQDSNQDTVKLMGALRSIKSIHFLDSIMCHGSNLAFVDATSGDNGVVRAENDIWFCSETLKLIQTGVRAKYDRVDTESVFDEMIMAIFVHEALHLFGYEHSKKMFKNVIEIMDSFDLHAVQNKRGEASKWMESLFIIKDGKAAKIPADEV